MDRLSRFFLAVPTLADLMLPATSENDRQPSPVQVWHAASSPSDAGVVEQCCHRWLDEEERARAARFRQATSRNQHIVGRGMARRLLGGQALAPESIRFDFEAHGKPYVCEPAEAKRPFNVAHTDGLVLCGISTDVDSLIGVDVERLHRRTDPGLADRYFSEPEIAYLKTKTTEASRRDAFLRVWTLKESFIKAIGTGLQTPLADFAFENIDSDNPSIRMLDPKLDSDRAWNFFSVQPRPGFIAAVAISSVAGDVPPSIEWREFESIV